MGMAFLYLAVSIFQRNLEIPLEPAIKDALLLSCTCATGGCLQVPCQWVPGCLQSFLLPAALHWTIPGASSFVHVKIHLQVRSSKDEKGCNFVRRYQILLLEGCTILCFPRNAWARLSFHRLSCKILATLWLFANMMSEKWHFALVFIYILLWIKLCIFFHRPKGHFCFSFCVMCISFVCFLFLSCFGPSQL